MHRGCFVWTPTPPLSGRRTPRPGPARVCVCVPRLAGSGGPASRARFGAPHLSFGRSCFALCLFAPPRAGVALFVVVCGFFFSCFVSLPLLPLVAPRCVLLRVFSGPGCNGPWRLVPPPLFFSYFPSPPSVHPVVSCFACFPAEGALGLGVLLPPPLPPPPPPCCLWRFLLPGCLGPMCPPPFFLVFLSCCLFSCCASAVCVLGCRAVCSLSCPFVVLCASSVLFLVAGVVGSWCCSLLFGVCWWLWLPGVVVWCVLALVPVSGLAVAGRPPCGVPSPCAVSCGAVLPCGAVLWCPVFFLFFSLLVAVVSCCSPLILGSGPVPGRCCFCALPVRCCAGVPAPLLSCPRGAGWCFVLLPVVFVCLLLGLAVLCCLLVGPGGSWCRVSVACCGVSLGAGSWLCVVVRCVVSFCSVWCCRALCCVLGRCLSSWGPVPSGAVFCLVPPHCVCFAVVCRRVVLFAVVLCAVCALGCRVVLSLSSPPCAVLLCGPLSLGALLPCAVPRGAVLPRDAVVSCPAALLGLFLAWVWLYLLEKPLQNFV